MARILKFDDGSDLPLIEPEMWSGCKSDNAPSMKKLMVKNLSLLGKTGAVPGKGIRGGNPARGSRAAATRTPSLSARRVIIKARVVKMTNGDMKSVDLHLKYIKRDGVGIEGEEGRLFGENRDAFSESELSSHLHNEQHQFRFIVSPEDAYEIDLEKFTRDLMQQAQKDLGKQLIWGAVCHHNTDNPHVHIVVRGVDRDGEQLWIDREYISNGFRNRAREIVTKELGCRTEWEIEQSINNEIRQERFTSLDRQLTGRLEGGKELHFAHYDMNDPGRFQDARLMSRIEKLKEIGLVFDRGPRKFEFVNGWQEQLKIMGRRGDIIKTIHAEMGRNDTGRYHIFDPKNNTVDIEGNVARIGLVDELSDRKFCIIEKTNGDIHYLPEKAITKEIFSHISEGQIVRIRTEQSSWLKAADKNIADIARANGNIYSVKQHLKTLPAQHVRVKGRAVERRDYVESHQRRVQRLCRFGLAQDVDDGKFLVADNLEKELASRDKTHPNKNLKIEIISSMRLDEMVQYPGRTWLDFHTADLDATTLAKHGFGHQVNKFAHQRAEYVRELGIDPADPARAKKLDKIQAINLVGDEMVKAGYEYVHLESNSEFTGKVHPVVHVWKRKKYLIIDNARSKQFTIVPWQQDFESLLARKVQLSMDVNSRFKIKAMGLDLSR
ncbi:MAG: DUF3363 domain-containing protein [Desulfobulbaceae bacterium]|nr:DUF3363 domain-containing protein [Desulfobulbaceae bacterium]